MKLMIYTNKVERPVRISWTKIIKFLVLSCLIVLLLSACDGNNASDMNSIESHIVSEINSLEPQASSEMDYIEEKSSGSYLSICYTTYDDGEGPENGMTTTVYAYDIELKEVISYSFPYSTQYPLGVIDKELNRLYFCQSSGAGDQVFMYDMDIGVFTQLTTDLNAVNYIIPCGEKVYCVVNPRGADEYARLKLVSIDINTLEMDVWLDDGDTNVETLCLDRSNGKIYISAYSCSQHIYNLRNQTGNEGMINPEGTIYETDLDFSTTRKIYSNEDHIARYILNHDNMVLAVLQWRPNRMPYQKAYIDVDTLEVSEFDIPDIMQRGEPAFTKDGTGIYMLTVVDDNRGIYLYDIESGSLTEIFTPMGDGFINSFMFIG